MDTEQEQAEQAAAEVADTEPQADQEQAEPAGASPSGKEAAKYRRRLREVEAERDRLAAQVEAIQRAEIERLSLAEHRVRGEALWAAGYTAGDLVDDDGRPDVSKVAAAANEVAERFGIRQIELNGAYVPAEGKTPPVAPTVTWGQLLHPHRP